MSYVVGVSTEDRSAIRDTLCVILHYGDEKDTLECLESIAHEEFLEIIVVDNDPAQKFSPPHGVYENLSVIRSGGEMGFAQANNFGVTTHRQDHHRYVLVLNNDIIAHPGSLSVLRETMRSEEIGLAGPVMPYFDEPDTIWAAGGKISRWLVTIDGIRKTPDKKLTDVDYLPGAAFLTRLDLWDEIGGLSEKYFLAFEEAEFALEVKKRGYRIVVNRDSTILHKVGMSSDRQPMYYYNTVRNRIRFGQYLFGKTSGAIFGALSGFLRSTSIMRLRIWFRAVADERAAVPLSRSALQNVRRNSR